MPGSSSADATLSGEVVYRSYLRAHCRCTQDDPHRRGVFGCSRSPDARPHDGRLERRHALATLRNKGRRAQLVLCRRRRGISCRHRAWKRSAPRKSRGLRYVRRPPQTGIQEIKQECHAPTPKGRRPSHFFTTFVRAEASAGQPAGFTFVVLPHAPSEASPDALAAQIAIDSGSNDAVSVRVSGRGDCPDVKFTLHGDEWSIARPQGR